MSNVSARVEETDFSLNSTDIVHIIGLLVEFPGSLHNIACKVCTENRTFYFLLIMNQNKLYLRKHGLFLLNHINYLSLSKLTSY